MSKIRTSLIIALAAIVSCFSSSAQSVKKMDGAYLEQLQQRDSILIADQLRYGVKLYAVQDGTMFAFPDWTQAFGDTLIIVKNWQIDTLKVISPKKKSSEPTKYDLSAELVIAPFEAGQYTLPRIGIQRTLPGGAVDTLLFEALEMEVTTIPVDTATFVIHDIKGQIRYPVTLKEVLPYILGFILLAALVAAAVYFIRRYLARKNGASEHSDPPYIVALRQLENYRGEKFWAPEKQKLFYSGITDTLRAYIADTFGIDAREMTTAEIFDALKGSERITPDLFNDTKSLFEVADFVKFAKHVVDDEENSKALPSAVRFVTSTYQSELDEQSAQTENEKE